MRLRMPLGPSRTRPEQVLGWVVGLLLVVGGVLILRPFISAFLWAAILCFSGWPVYRRLTAALGQRRTLAAALMGLGLALVILVPVVFVGATMADNVRDLTMAARKSLAQGPPPPPEWLSRIPLIGPPAAQRWLSLAADTDKFWIQARQLIEPVSTALLKLGLLLGRGLVQLGLSILIAFFLFRDGATLAKRLSRAVDRIGGVQSRPLLTVAGNTIRGVVYGILGTALVQAILAGIGFLIAGVPGAGVLALLTFIVSILPVLGTAMVWLPAAIWLFFQGAAGWGIFMIVWGIGVNSVEYMIKPLLISKGSDMPFLLIFFGVIGGAMAFGFIGVFLGPTLLAVLYRVVEEWSATARVTGPVSPVGGPHNPKTLVHHAVGRPEGDS